MNEQHSFIAACSEREVRPAAIRALMSQGMDFEEACSLYSPDLSLYFTYRGLTLRFDDFCIALKIKQSQALHCFNELGMSLDELVVHCGLDSDHEWEQLIGGLTPVQKSRRLRFVLDDGKEYTITQIGKKFNIPTADIIAQLEEGKTIREVLKTALRPKRDPACKTISPNSLDCIHEIDGEKKQLREWLDHFGIGINAYRSRIRKGMTVEEALKTPVRKQKPVHGYNAFYMVENLCREFEIAPDWVQSIMRKRGLTADEALNYAINYNTPEDAFYTMNGDMLTQIREAKKLDTWDLAEKVRRLTGIRFTGTMVYAIEKGRRKVSIDEIESICCVLKVKPEKVLDVSDFMKAVRDYIKLHKKDDSTPYLHMAE